jgi:hypothetical protein
VLIARRHEQPRAAESRDLQVVERVEDRFREHGVKGCVVRLLYPLPQGRQ